MGWENKGKRHKRKKEKKVKKGEWKETEKEGKKIEGKGAKRLFNKLTTDCGQRQIRLIFNLVQ